MTTKKEYRYFIIIQECDSEFYTIKYIILKRISWSLGNLISIWVCAWAIHVQSKLMHCPSNAQSNITLLTSRPELQN